MKLSSIAGIVLVTVMACARGDSGATDTSAASTAAATPAASASGDACVVGTYTQSSPSFSPKFVFNADGTGEETQAASQGGKTRKFNWKTKSASDLTITFPAEGDSPESSMDWAYNCDNGTFANMYKKQ